MRPSSLKKGLQLLCFSHRPAPIATVFRLAGRREPALALHCLPRLAQHGFTRHPRDDPSRRSRRLLRNVPGDLTNANVSARALQMAADCVPTRADAITRWRDRGSLSPRFDRLLERRPVISQKCPPSWRLQTRSLRIRRTDAAVLQIYVAALTIMASSAYHLRWGDGFPPSIPSHPKSARVGQGLTWLAIAVFSLGR